MTQIESMLTFFRKNKKITVFLMLILGVFCIGLSAIFVKIASVPGPVTTFYRLFFAAIFVVPWQIKKGFKEIEPKHITFFAIGGIFFALDLILWNTSILLTSAATATLLGNNAPIWVGLGSFFFFKEKLKPVYWLGLAFALLGIIITIGFNGILHLSMSIGNLLALVAGMFYAAYLLTTQKARTKIDTVTFMAISVLSGTIIALFVCIIFNYNMLHYPLKSWLALLGMGIISHLIGWLAINYALGYIKASTVSVTLLGQVLVTAVLSYPILGEVLTIQEIVGGLILLIGIYLVNKR